VVVAEGLLPVGLFGLFVVGEGVALYAVATAKSSTFLVVVPLVAVLLAARERESEMKLAETLEAQAKEIRGRME